MNGGQGTGAKSGGEGTISTRTVPRPKTASAVRGPPSLLSVRGAAVVRSDLDVDYKRCGYLQQGSSFDARSDSDRA